MRIGRTFESSHDYVPFKYQIVEDASNGNGRMKIRGKFQECDIVNGNGRIYPRNVFEKILGDARFMDSVNRRQMLGELDHPADGKTSLKRASHVITGIELQPDGQVVGEVEVLDTPSGKVLEALFKAGVEVGISSRGSGSVKDADVNGRQVEEVQPDYTLKTFDFVQDPSTPGARPKVVNEDQSEDIPEETSMNLVEQMKSVRTAIDEVRAGIRPGANYSALEHRLIEAEVAANALKKTDESYAETAADLKAEIRQTRIDMEKVRKTDRTTVEGLRAQLEAAQVYMDEMAAMIREYRTKPAGPSNEDLTRAIESAVDELDVDAIIREGLGMTQDELAEMRAAKAGGETPATQARVEELELKLDAAKVFIESLLRVYGRRANKAKIESLLANHPKANDLRPLLEECGDVRQIVERFEKLQKFAGTPTPAAWPEDLPNPHRRSPKIVEQKVNESRQDRITQGMLKLQPGWQ